MRLADLKGSLIRPQLRFLNKRPENLRPQNETIHRSKPKQGRKGEKWFLWIKEVKAQLFFCRKRNFKYSLILCFFSSMPIKFGVGILNFQTNLVRSINNDGWIAILISGMSVNVMIFLMYLMFKKAPSDEFGEITQYVLAKWVGQLFNILYILYFASLSLTVLIHYMDVIHVWLFKRFLVFCLRLYCCCLCITFIPAALEPLLDGHFLALYWRIGWRLFVFMPWNIVTFVSCSQCLIIHFRSCLWESKMRPYPCLVLARCLSIIPLLNKLRHLKNLLTWGHYLRHA